MDYIDKLFEPGEQTAQPKKIGMVVQSRCGTSQQIDEEEAAEHDMEKWRLPIAFWDGETDELEPLSPSDLARLHALNVEPWEWECLVTENYLDLLAQRESSNV